MKKWDTATLEEACSSIKNGLAVKQSEDAGGTPITRIETIAKWKINPNKCGYAGLEAKEYTSRLLQHGDILFSHINSLDHLGKTAIYEGTPNELIHGMNLLGIRANQDRITPSYLLLCLRSDQVNAQVLKAANKSVNQASISTTNLKKIKIPLPPLSEQKRIAGILDAADALRAQRSAALAQLDTLLQSTFLDLFGDPVTNPKGWDVVPLGNLGTLDRGVSKHRPRNEPALLGGNHPLIQTGDVANSEGYIRKYKSTYSDLGLKQSKMWPKGTLCITIAANIASTGILTFDACFPDSVVGFKSEDVGRIQYVQSLFWFLKKMLEASAPQVAQKNINLKILRELPVPAPPLPLQQRFAAIVEQVEAQKVRMRAQLTELDTLFAALQQRAFNGEL